MSYFTEILAHVLRNEGGYSDDPNDAGGETFYGISRRYHPLWPGWVVIDKIKGRGGHPESGHSQLAQAVEEFYRANFWHRIQGEKLPKDVATEVFDTAVNVGVHRASSWLQQALNILNRNGKSYPDILEDGELGPATLRALGAYLKSDSTGLLLKVMNVLQGAHYLEYMKKAPAQEKYARGWFARVSIPTT